MNIKERINEINLKLIIDWHEHYQPTLNNFLINNRDKDKSKEYLGLEEKLKIEFFEKNIYLIKEKIDYINLYKNHYSIN